MKRLVLVAVTVLALAGCVQKPYPPGPYDMAPSPSYGPVKKDTSTASTSASPTASPSPAPTESAIASASTTPTDEGCTKGESGDCIEAGQPCSKAGETGKDAEGTAYKCEADGKQNRWRES